MTNAIAAIVAALAEHEAPLYLRGYYRVALPQPPGRIRVLTFYERADDAAGEGVGVTVKAGWDQ